MGQASPIERGLVCRYGREKLFPASEAFGRPVLLALVVPGHGGHPARELHPRLFRGREDMDVGRQEIRLVEGADPNELDHRS